VRAVITIHRDFGDRQNRKHARLKYILAENGVEWFRAELERRIGFALQPVQPMAPFEVDDHLGWHHQAEGLLYIGIPVENGRVVDRGDARLRTGLRAVIEQFNLSVRLTGQQNILLTGIPVEQRDAVDALLAEYGI